MRKIYLKVAMLASLFALSLFCPQQADAKVENVMCMKTNTGNYFPLARVSMMVVADGASTFEIVLKNNEGGEANVSSISFEKSSVDIDLSKYKWEGSTDTYPSPSIDSSKKIYLLTSTGKYFQLSEKPQVNTKDGSDLMDITVGSATESNVKTIYFYRGDNPEGAGIDAPTVAEETLQLMTPVSSQIQISGCGSAKVAVLYSTGGQKMGEAAVENGMTTLQVGQLTPGMYIVKVGKKALKFMKK